MPTTPIRSRGWCDLSTCTQGPAPSDCVRLGTITVCEPCLIEWGGSNATDILSQLAASLDSVGEPEIADRVREDREKYTSGKQRMEVVR